MQGLAGNIGRLFACQIDHAGSYIFGRAQSIGRNRAHYAFLLLIRKDIGHRRRYEARARQFTVILRLATSWANDFENPSTPAFEAA